jgi:hypothetical protein
MTYVCQMTPQLGNFLYSQLIFSEERKHKTYFICIHVSL